jgi:beta-glucosidase
MSFASNFQGKQNDWLTQAIIKIGCANPYCFAGAPSAAAAPDRVRVDRKMTSRKTVNSVFPSGFVWGAATAAPQIEGAAFEGGKGESVWDRFSRIPGKILNGDTLDVACDHYHRFPEDFALMRELGIRNYRLSISWPRIFPKGDGAVNQEGLDFYHRLFDSLAENGITPWVTMFHWDLPQALEDRGGWTERATVDAFAHYAETIVKEFSGRVKHWFTLNEIRCFTFLAYGPWGISAPGRLVSPQQLNQTYHHALVCHGHGVRAVRTFGGEGAQVGLTDNCDTPIPVTETEADIAAANAWFVERNLHILDAIHRGRYSESYLVRVGTDAPVVAPGDFELISAPTDFLGINIYTGYFVRATPGGGHEVVDVPHSYPRADSKWLKFTPQAIYWGLRLAHENYGLKRIFVTENGCGYDDEPVINGEVHDLHRREFLRSYLRELHRAIEDGVPVGGYFVWSLLDNYEWADGYVRRFGLVHVDYATQVRTPKLSSRYYSDIIRLNTII